MFLSVSLSYPHIYLKGNVLTESKGKETDGHRLTHLLRPNITRPTRDAWALNPLETPPATDLSELSSLSSHELETTDHSDLDRGLSDVAESDVDRLSVVAESDASRAGSPAFNVERRVMSDDEWSIVHEADIEADLSDVDGSGLGGLADSVGSLSLSVGNLEQTPRPVVPRRSLGRNVSGAGPWVRQDRGTSSPSRSPARRTPRRKTRAKVSAKEAKRGKSFYNYLFA